MNLAANYKPEVMYDDILSRDTSSTPYVDIYIAGFPSQPFTSTGKQKGFVTHRLQNVAILLSESLHLA